MVEIVAALGAADCERIGSGWLAQPANAVSSLAYAGVGIWLLRQSSPAGGRRGLLVAGAAALVAVGLGSFLFHGPQPGWALVAHDVSILGLVLVVATGHIRLLAAAIRPRRRAVRSAAGSLAAVWRPPAVWVVVALLAYWTGRTGSSLCAPDSLWQPHAAWHTASAVSLGLVILGCARRFPTPMPMPHRAVVLVALVVLGLPAAAGSYGAGRLACRLTDERVSESSGVASTSWSGDVIWTHNDSGDRPRFFAVETATCTVRAVYDVAGARAVDWEDMARSQTTLHLADIGDNDARRGSVTIYDVPEPVEGAPGGTVRPSAARVLRYPDGARDAESVFVDPATGRLAIVTKALAGDAAVYLAPQAGNGEMERVAAVPVTWVTGADARADRIIVRDYLSAYEWTVRPGEALAGTLQAPPEPVGLPLASQGEAIGYARDASGIWTTSERRGGPGQVHFVPGDEPLAQDATEEGTEEEDPGADGSFPVAGVVGVAAALAVVIVVLTRRRSAVRSRTNG